MMGSAILSVPFVTYKLGWLFTALILIHSVLVALITMHYFSTACYYTKADSYKELVLKLLGKKAGLLLDISLIISYYGFMTAYIIVSSNGVVNFA